MKNYWYKSVMSVLTDPSAALSMEELIKIRDVVCERIEDQQWVENAKARVGASTSRTQKRLWR